MALMKCSECAKDVSDKATACPHCGAPLGSASQPTQASSPMQIRKIMRAGAKYEGIGFALIVLGIVLGIFASPPVSTIGGIGGAIGFVVIIIGRFM